MVAAGHSAVHPLAEKSVAPVPFSHTLWKLAALEAVGLSCTTIWLCSMPDGPRPPPALTTPRKESEKNQTTRPSSTCWT